jgi:FkbM family methyltransferase
MTLLALPLPNNTTCHLVSGAMRPAAEVLKWEIFSRGRYAHSGFELRPTDIVLDVGGNVGVFMLWAAPQMPRGRVVSVEPAPRAFACLKMNVERNKLGNVTAIHAAAGAREGTLKLVTYPGLEGLTHAADVPPPSIGQVLQKTGWATRVSAPLLPLSRIMDEQRLERVDYLKLDCEGAEFEILRGLPDKYWPRIARIAIEFHDAGADRRHGELVSILKARGYNVEVEASWIERHILKSGAIWARRK